ncbi:hypothetical protein D6779_02855 [Candidatus Parcubacteria bacterium]|nr:MAG: hypothetical protein D6779_02855 [Candidatus Parcubacteria bacterium]
MNLPPKVVMHGLVGGALSELSGGDFTTGAIATATSHIAAEYIKEQISKNFDPDNPPFDINDPKAADRYAEKVTAQAVAISRMLGGAAAIAVHPDMSSKELNAATGMAEGVARENSFKLFSTGVKIFAKVSKLKKIDSKSLKKILKDEGMDLVGDAYTLIDPTASKADIAWALADIVLGTSFNNRIFAVAKKFGGKGQKPSKTVDSILTGTHKYDEPNLNKRINQRADFSSGATHITSGKKLDERIIQGDTNTIGNPEQLYVLPTYQADKLLNRKGVTKSDIEKSLGLNRGVLANESGPVTRFDIKNPEKRNMRLPDPATGNQYHRPKTGLTAGGQTERVIDTPKLNDPSVKRTDLNIPRGTK